MAGISLEALVRHRAAIDAFVTEHRVLAVLAYIGLYIAAVALSVPGAVFLTVSGGFLFGLVVGASAAVIGATIGATLIFLVARTALGEPLAAAGGPARDQAWRRAFATMPSAICCSCGWCRRFRSFWSIWCRPSPACGSAPFVAATALGVIPAAFVYAFAGTGLDSIITAQKNCYQRLPRRRPCRLPPGLRRRGTS